MFLDHQVVRILCWTKACVVVALEVMKSAECTLSLSLRSSGLIYRTVAWRTSDPLVKVIARLQRIFESGLQSLSALSPFQHAFTEVATLESVLLHKVPGSCLSSRGRCS